MRRAARRIVALWMACTWAATLWLMSLNPFAQPVIERSAAELRIALQRAMAVRLALLGVPALAIPLAVVQFWPECLAGHYNMLDPVVRAFWLEPILQEKPVFFQKSPKF